MEKLEKLIETMSNASLNFRFMHWTSIGINFKYIHEDASKMYELMSSDIDLLMEAYMSMCSEQTDFSFVNQYLSCDKLSYNTSSYISTKTEILEEIMSNIKDILSSCHDDNICLKLLMEDLYCKYEKELKYFTKRILMK